MKKLSLLLIVFICLSSVVCAQYLTAKTTVYIVRHAEKDLSDSKNSDPELSIEGQDRAKALAKYLKKEKLAAIFATNYKRTTQTGNVVSERNKLSIELYNAADPNALARFEKSKNKGQKILILGHSNTVLELAEAFGVMRPLAARKDDDYEFIFKNQVDDSGYASIYTGNYGKPHNTSIIKQKV